MIKHTFLVEIGTEELPPKALRALGESFATQMSAALKISRINHDEISWFATPRRLAVKSAAIDSIQADMDIERRGPAVFQAFNAEGNPTELAENWARDCGITVTEAERLTTEKGEWLVCRDRVKGKPVQELLGNIVRCTLDKMSVLKMMRWGNNNSKFIRPVHTVTILLDDSIITCKVLGIDTNRILRGHRFMGESEISLDHADHYQKALLVRGRVIADYFQRKEMIRRDAEAAAKSLGGIIDLNDSLLEEVTSLVEWPVVLTAQFEEKFLVVPAEALVYTMQCDQKYFPVYDKFGNLLPYFIFVANIESKDPKQIITGNERVIRSRLADAEFFFNIDKKQRLEDRLPRLETVLFQKKLGTLRDTSNRIEGLSAWIAQEIGANVSQAARAGLLSKCDLITNMVFEFTDTQGTMGMYYARHDGEPEAVALAQKEQYYPRFSGDDLPTTQVSCAVAIAEKMDRLTGIIGIGQCPTGHKDPFALRRAARGVLRIIVEKKLPLDLQTLTEEAIRLYGEKLTNHKLVVENIIEFMLSRFFSWYQEQGHSIDVIQAVLVRRPTCPVDFDDRVRAVSDFRTTKDAKALIAVNKRISNILEKAKDPAQEVFQTLLFKSSAEIRLATHLIALQKKLQPMFKAGLYQKALVELSSLCEPVDAFFNSIMVMVEDYQVRINRLTLLAQLRELFLKIADISFLQ